MITPDFATFKRLAQKGNLIAVAEQIPADLETPVSSFLKLAKKAPHAFLLESAEQEERIGRYSFIGLEPEAILTASKGRITLTQKGRTSVIKTKEHLIGVIEKTLSTYRLANPESLPVFCGGFVGYLSYENVRDFEAVHLAPHRGPNIPEGIFFLSREFLIFDHFRKTLSVVTLAEVRSRKKLATLYQNAKQKIEKNITLLERPLHASHKPKNPAPINVRSNMTPASFRQKVQKIKNYIRAGDCIQVVLSQRFTMPGVTDDFQIYRALRSINPSPYMFYFRSGKLCLFGSSPELLVKKTGREAEVRPIAGTRPGGRPTAED